MARSSRLEYRPTSKGSGPLAVFRSYQQAIAKLGGKQLNTGFTLSDDGVQYNPHVFSLTAGKTPVVVVLQLDTSNYYLNIIEQQPLVDKVAAGQLASELQANGVATLYIEFETAKAALNNDGRAVAKEVAALLQANPALRLSIEGHTDNVGQAADNKRLSLERAEAVMRFVVASGIDAKRLTAVGHGQDYPIADNRREEGRSKNRRVELVKLK